MAALKLMRNHTLRADVQPLRALRLLAFIASLSWITAPAATLAPGVQQKLTSATFEVVLAKPTNDPLTYEKPLPLELLPYRERTDLYRSIGTAFAIGQNRFVTAAHVLSAGNSSQYGPLALRDSAGRIYPVDKVLKYSGSEDYSVFSVHSPPTLAPLLTRSRPPLNTPVFAVGNAYGDGVVVRDGLYTSDTPEELDGRWQWLRFSAAASPGNSGGPLIDRTGKVVGVVLRKSPNENLNFALAIGQVLDGSEISAVIEARSSYGISVMSAADSVRRNDTIALPKPLEEFYASLHQSTNTWMATIHAEFMKNHADTIFPEGNSLQLLSSVYAEAFPRLIHQSDGGTWTVGGETPKKVQLDKNGYLQALLSSNVLLLRLKAPDDVSPPELVADSKKFMDLILKGFPFVRPVGSDAVRITSMGKANTEVWDTDTYGRKWLIRTWLLPFNDTVITIVGLPTPDGMVMMMGQEPTVAKDLAESEMQELRGFLYLSYTGSLAQWRSFLANQSVLPRTVLNTKVQFDYGRGLGVRTSRFEMLAPIAVVHLDDQSVLMLKYSYMKNDANTVWDLGGVYLSENIQGTKWVGMLRRVKPAQSLPEEMERHWQEMTKEAHPWEGMPFLSGGRTEINAMMNAKAVAAGKAVGYTMTLNSEGSQPVNKVKAEFSALERGFTTTE
jgi:serine protease Do